MPAEDHDITLRQDDASLGLPRPVRRLVQGEPGTVIYSGYAAHEGLLPYPSGVELFPASALAALALELPGTPVVLMPLDAHGRRVHSQGLVSARRPATTAGTVLAAEVVDTEIGKAIQVDVAVHLEEAQRVIDAGAGLSVSSQVEIDPTPGTYRGDAYVAVQVRRYSPDHVLITDIPRAAGARIRADAGEPMTPEQIQQLAEALAAALKPLLAPAEPAAPEAPAMDAGAMADLQQRADALEAELYKRDLAEIQPALKAAGLGLQPKTSAEIQAAWAAIGRAAQTRADASGTGPASPPMPVPADPATSSKAPSRRIF